GDCPGVFGFGGVTGLLVISHTQSVWPGGKVEGSVVSHPWYPAILQFQYCSNGFRQQPFDIKRWFGFGEL
ncbi:hypothetical protein, partial [Thiolapillus sp.]|uniref:hypothetical protein n=1 Tax=Thiolapillus sp. TaxID=2017437 RepID=UPI003AF5C2DB